MRKRLSLTVAAVLLAVLLAALAACGGDGGKTEPPLTVDGDKPLLSPASDAPSTAYEEKTLSADTYYDKTLSGVIGQMVGFLSGYEFVWEGNNKPRVGMPDEWFQLCNGPYAGNWEHFGPGEAYLTLYDRLRYNDERKLWEVWSDDDYHIDFFNQTILDEAEAITPAAVKDAWKKYNVSDWGGGYSAKVIFDNKDLLPPYSGMKEYGNQFHWCTEPYIENDTLGMNAPGMPVTAMGLADLFASATGDFDSLIWAKFDAALYSLAYFETDARELLKKAAPALPEGSYPRFVYDKCFELYAANPNDWRASARWFDANRRYYRGIDNIQTSVDVNNAYVLLALLYGDTDYVKTCKIASLAGYDAETNASIATGLIGVMKGTADMPEAVNTYVYQNGEGLYRNDVITSYVPKINSKLYPEVQKITDIARLYQKNTEKIIVQSGGKVEGGSYRIKTCAPRVNPSLIWDNYDFEQGTLAGYEGDSTSGRPIDAAASKGSDAHTGDYYAQLYSLGEAADAKLYRSVTLERGSVYALSAYVKTSVQGEGRLFASNADGSGLTYTSVYGNTEYCKRTLIFLATDSVMRLGVYIPEGYAATKSVCVDDFTLEKLYVPGGERFALSGGKVTGTVRVESQSDYGGNRLVAIGFANPTAKYVTAAVKVNGITVCNAQFAPTGKKAEFSANVLYLPLYLPDDPAIELDFGAEEIYVTTVDIVDDFIKNI